MISGTIIVDYETDLFVPNDMKDFIQLIYKKDWNHNIYSHIIKKYTNIPYTTISNVQEFENLQIVSTLSLRNRAKQSFIAFCNKIASFFSRDTDAFLLNTYLSFINEIRLHLSMKQIPRLIPEVPIITTSVDQSKRKWKLIGEKNQTEFEECIRNLIPQHIPTLYLEGFANLRCKVNNLSWPYKPKVIFTSSSYSTDDLFKLYAAEKTEKGIPLVIGQHGGGIGTHLWAFYEEHQLAICDSFLSWGWTDASEPKVKSIGQLKTKFPLGVQHSKKNGIMLVMIKSPVQSFHLFSSPIAGQWLDYFNDQCNFVDNLSDKIRERMTLRLKSDDLGWEPASRLKDRYPDIAIDEGNFNINNLIKKSRIYVSTYNATSFLEAFTMNIPTIMFWNPNHWELKDAAIPYFDMLKEVGILYDSPEKAAKHVNSIWDNVDLWWESDILQNTLNFFKKEYSHIPKDNIVNLISSQLNEVILNSKHAKN
jgi:putative transferase (TIGR04331 family)